MALDIIVGAQWGDEGKGRMVDLLASQADVVARFSGGDNAGHTVVIGDRVFKLHLVPSGIVHPHAVGVLGNGMVINPEKLLEEMDSLVNLGVAINPARLKISAAAHLITPIHRALDAAQEADRGAGKIGTTLRGIGPAYVDKVARRGLRAGMLKDEEELADRVQAHVEVGNITLEKIFGAALLDPAAVATEFINHARRLAPYIVDTSAYVDKMLRAGKTVLAEGAQGTLLDIDHGSYPYVTSSSPTAPGALIGLGVGLKNVGEVVGVTKVFQTRVGEGALPSELLGEMGDRLRGTGENYWDEFGTTTGRPRRVGWLDLVLLRYASRMNGFTKLALTKLDILSGINPLKVCVAYKLDGEEYRDLPLGLDDLDLFEPVYEEVPGWEEDVQPARTWDELPPNAQAYIRKIEEVSGIPVGWVSVGPERDQVVTR